MYAPSEAWQAALDPHGLFCPTSRHLLAGLRTRLYRQNATTGTSCRAGRARSHVPYTVSAQRQRMCTPRNELPFRRSSKGTVPSLAGYCSACRQRPLPTARGAHHRLGARRDRLEVVRVIQKHGLPASVRHLVPAAFVLTMLMLPILALIWPWTWWLWGALGVLYCACSLAASMATARRSGLMLCLVLPAMFACYHLGYSYGFLRGIWDFIILRRTPVGAMSTLTR
jgi:hypothetical protein